MTTMYHEYIYKRKQVYKVSSYELPTDPAAGKCGV